MAKQCVATLQASAKRTSAGGFCISARISSTRQGTRLVVPLATPPDNRGREAPAALARSEPPAPAGPSRLNGRRAGTSPTHGEGSHQRGPPAGYDRRSLSSSRSVPWDESISCAGFSWNRSRAAALEAETSDLLSAGGCIGRGRMGRTRSRPGPGSGRNSSSP